MVEKGQIIIADGKRYEVDAIWIPGASKVIDFTARMTERVGTDAQGFPVYNYRGFSYAVKNWELVVCNEQPVLGDLTGKVISSIEHINTDSMYGLTQSGMKINFVDGTSLVINIETDEDLSDHPNLDWRIDLPKVVNGENEK